MKAKTHADWIKLRRKMELSILRCLIQSALQKGCAVSVYNGGEMAEVMRATTLKAIMDACMASDGDALVLYREGKPLGRVDLVYGNSGWDVISDHTDNDAVRDVVKPAEDLAARLEGNAPAWVMQF